MIAAAIGAFAGTNLNDMVLLAVLFFTASQTTGRTPAGRSGPASTSAELLSAAALRLTK